MTCAPSRVPKPRHGFAVTNVHGFRDFFQRSSRSKGHFPKGDRGFHPRERRRRPNRWGSAESRDRFGEDDSRRKTTPGRKRVRRRVFIIERRFCHTASSRVVSGCATATPASPLVSLRLRPAFLRRRRERRRAFLARKLRFRRLRLRLARFLAPAGAAAWVRIRPGGGR